jgi:hypothetical protein
LLLQLGDVGKKFYVEKEEFEDCSAVALASKHTEVMVRKQILFPNVRVN